jgi:hypothetical protein
MAKGVGQIMPFGDYAPDLAKIRPGGLMEAANVWRSRIAYHPIPSPVYTDTFPTRVRNAVLTQAVKYGGTDDAYQFFVGTDGYIFEVTKDGIVDRSRHWMELGHYEAGRWEFAQYGDDLIAVNPRESLLRVRLEDRLPIRQGKLGRYIPADKTLRPIIPPRAAHIGVIREFVVVGRTFDYTDGWRRQRVRWSAADDPLNWKPEADTLSDFQDLLGDGGDITGIVGGEYGLVFQENAVYRMTYAGQPLAFQFDKIESARGAAAPGSIVDIGNAPDGGRAVFFLAHDGFFRQDGQASHPIGQNVVDRTILSKYNKERADEVCGGHDPTRQSIWWTIPIGLDGFDTWCYHYNLGLWTHVPSVKGRWFGLAFRPVHTLNEEKGRLNAALGSFDDPVNQKQFCEFAVIDVDNRLGFFNGPPLPATFITSEAVQTNNYAGWINSIRPIADAKTWAMSLGYRLNLDVEPTWTPPRAPDYDGEAKFHASPRYLQVRLDIDGFWEEAQGLIYTMERRGRR